MTERQKNVWGLCIAFSIVFFGGFFLFYPVLHKGFYLIDDSCFVNALPASFSWNAILQIFQTNKSIFLPVVGLTYYLEKFLTFGHAEHFPFALRLGNLFYVSVSSTVVFALIFHAKKNMALALWGTVLFAFHPMHASTITWIAARKDILVCLFLLLTLLHYQKGHN